MPTTCFITTSMIWRGWGVPTQRAVSEDLAPPERIHTAGSSTHKPGACHRPGEPSCPPSARPTRPCVCTLVVGVGRMTTCPADLGHNRADHREDLAAVGLLSHPLHHVLEVVPELLVLLGAVARPRRRAERLLGVRGGIRPQLAALLHTDDRRAARWDLDRLVRDTDVADVGRARRLGQHARHGGRRGRDHDGAAVAPGIVGLERGRQRRPLLHGALRPPIRFQHGRLAERERAEARALTSEVLRLKRHAAARVLVSMRVAEIGRVDVDLRPLFLVHPRRLVAVLPLVLYPLPHLHLPFDPEWRGGHPLASAGGGHQGEGEDGGVDLGGCRRIRTEGDARLAVREFGRAADGQRAVHVEALPFHPRVH